MAGVALLQRGILRNLR